MIQYSSGVVGQLDIIVAGKPFAHMTGEVFILLSTPGKAYRASDNRLVDSGVKKESVSISPKVTWASPAVLRRFYNHDAPLNDLAHVLTVSPSYL